MSSTVTSVFVYGTLKPGGKNFRVAECGGAFSVREAYVEGMRLYALEPESYPAMIPGEGRVHGFVLDYEDIAAALPHLDALEGCDLSPPLYHRVLTKVHPTGETVWTYLYARRERLSAPGVTLLPAGIWRYKRLLKTRLLRRLT